MIPKRMSATEEESRKESGEGSKKGGGKGSGKEPRDETRKEIVHRLCKNGSSSQMAEALRLVLDGVMIRKPTSNVINALLKYPGVYYANWFDSVDEEEFFYESRCD